GMYLWLAQALLLAVYVVVTWPMFAALTHTFWPATYREFWYVPLAFGSVLVLGTSSVVALVSLVSRPPPRPESTAATPRGAGASWAALRDRIREFLVAPRGSVVGLGTWVLGLVLTALVLLIVSLGRGLLGTR